MEHLFGELRSLLSQAPSAAGWDQVCALCDAEVAVDAGRFEAEVLPYVSDGLRGWPDALRAGPKGWIDAISASGAHPCGPLVRRLARQPSGDVRRLFAAPCLAQVAEVSLSALGVNRLDALEGASMLGAVRVLELGGAGPEGAEALFARMPGLTELHASFGTNAARDALLDALEASGRLPALESLWMAGMGFMAADAARLGVCKRLRELAVWSSSGLRDAGVAAICEALADAPLVHLNVGGCGLTGASVARIAQLPWRLEQLLIWDNALSDEAALLGEHEAFGALRLLNLNKTQLRGVALAPLLSRRGPQPLRELWCDEQGQLGGKSWRAAALGETARGLDALHARQAKLDSNGSFEGLMEGMDGGRMRRLLIPHNRLGAAHMLVLRDARLPDLRELELNSNPIGDEGVAALLGAEWVEGLEVLKVSGCRLTMAVVDTLRAHAPRLRALRELHTQVDGVGDDAVREAICGALPGLSLKMVSWG